MLKLKNIWFHCPACEKKLVVGVEAGGYRADCPECGVNIPIPTRSTAYPAWAKKVLVTAMQAALLVAGVGIGWGLAFAPADHADETGRSPSAAQAEKTPLPPGGAESASGASPSAADDINQQLLNEHVELQGRYNKMVQWMIDNYRGKYPLPERLVSRLRIPPMTDQGRVNPELAEMLRLSAQETALVEDVLGYVRENIQRAERERARITDQTESRITYSVPTFSEVGAELREDLFLTLENTLGENRFDRLVDVSGESLREQMNYFGEASRTLTFEVIFPATEGAHPPYLLIRDGWMIPDGESVRLTRVTETAVMQLPESYRPYQNWLPEPLSRYAMP